MVLINYATKEIVAKIVYYGPALCGKTTNLQYIYTKLSPKKRGKMISLSTESDRTLFFDFLPLELGKIQGFKVRFQLYTVPGQVFYGATRRLVLKGADAIVFVADSQEAVLDMNLESIEDMKSNLIENNLDPETIPLVIQYNKRDLNGIMEVEDLDRHINWRGVPHTEAVAITGPGVMETFFEITKLLIQDLKKKHSVIDSDAIKELPPDIFEQEKEEDVLEAEDIVFEIEHGSGYHDESAGEEVVAGEMLDMIETIAVSDTTLAEEFFDDVRKGVPADEAREKVMGTSAADEQSPAIEMLGSSVRIGRGEKYVREDESVLPFGERELTPEELEFTGEPAEIMPAAAGQGFTAEEPFEADPYVVPASQRTEPAEPVSKTARPEKKPEKTDEKRIPAAVSSGAQPSPPVSETSPVKKPSLQPIREETPAAQTDMRMAEVMESLARLAKDVSQLGVRLDKKPEQRPEPGVSAGPDITPELTDIKASLGRLEQEVSALRLTLTMMKESTANAIHAAGPSGGPELKTEFDELKRQFKEAFEGQDRLLLAVLEAARESKQSNSDAHEKLEDALRYIAGSVRGEGGKKKWF